MDLFYNQLEEHAQIRGTLFQTMFDIHVEDNSSIQTSLMK